MKSKKIIGLISLLILGLFIRYIYVQVIFGFSRKGGSIGSYTIEDAKEKGSIIKEFKPNVSLVEYNEQYDIIIKKAWLEYNTYSVNSKLWISEIPDKERLYFNIKYGFRDRKTGEIKDELDHVVRLYFSDLQEKNNSSRLVGFNLLYMLITEKPQKEYKYVLHIEGVKNSIITFR